MSNKYVDSLTDWDDFKHTLGLTTDEWDEIDLKVKIVGEIIEARRSQEITQQALEALSGVRQPVIARLEGNNSDPRLTTVLKILRPLGKTLAIVPIESMPPVRATDEVR
jgi:DNA-binding XRE family transcriptional regulator